MATIEDLHFNLILDDKEFNAEISEMTKKAELFNLKMSEMLGEKGGTTSSGLAKRISELGDLRRQIKETVDSISILQNRMQTIYERGGANGGNLFLMGDTQNKIDALNAQLAVLAQREREISGDSSVAAALDNITESIHKQSIESLQLSDALRRQAEEAERLDKAEKAQKKADQSAKIKAEKEARRALTEQKKKELEWQKKIDAQFAISNEQLRKAKTNVDQFRASQAGLNLELDKGSRLMRGLTSLAATYFSVAGASRLVRSLVDATKQFEFQRVTLRAILKDIDAADAIFSQIKELAVISPFTFKELVTYTKQLSAFSVPMNELYDTTKMLADVSAGLGVGMDRLILAYGQIRSAGVLRGQELRQLTEAGIPVLNELKQKFIDLGETAITTSDIFDKISTRQVPFEMIAEIFRDMTSEGGKFYKMQEVQAETLQGKLSNLTDAYQIMFSEIGEKLNPAMKQGIDWLRGLAENYEETGRKIANLITIYGTYRVTLGAIRTLQRITTFETGLNAMIVNAQAAGQAITRLRAAIQMLTTAQAANNAVAAANVYAAIAAAVAMAIVGIAGLIRKLREQDTVTKGLKKTAEVYNQTLATETAQLELLFNRLRNAEKGTKDYDSAKRQILSTYDKYLDDIDRENLALGRQAEVYASLTTKIRENAAMKAYTEGMEDISGEFLKQQNKIIKDVISDLGRSNLGKNYSAVAKQITQLIRGEIKKEDLSQVAKDALQSFDDAWQAYYKTQGYGPNRTSFIAPRIDDAIKDYAAISEEMRMASGQLSDSVDIMYGVDFSKQTGDLEDWKKSVNEITKDMGDLGRQLSADNFSTRESYIDELVKKYNEANETLRKFGKTENAETKAAKALIPMITRVTDAMGVSIQNWTKTGGAGGGSASSDPMIHVIDNRIRKLQELQKIYGDISEYISDDVIAKNFGSIFEDGFNFDQLIEDQLQAMEALGKEGEDKAREIRAQMRLDAAKNQVTEMLAFHQRIKTYVTEQKSIEEQIADLNAKKAQDLARLTKGTAEYAATEAHYNAEIGKLKEQLMELNSIQMTDFWRELTGADEDYSYKRLTKLYDQLVELQDILKKIEPIRSDKGLVIGYQIKKDDVQNEELAKALGLTDENSVISITVSQFQQLIKALGDTSTKMRSTDAIRTYFKLLKDGAADADKLRMAFVAAAKEIGGLVSGIGEIGDTIADLGESTDNGMLESFGRVLKVATDITDTLLENESLMSFIVAKVDKTSDVADVIFKTSDWITLAIKAAAFVIEQIAGAVKSNYEMQLKLNEAAIAYRDALHEISLASADTIFGTDNMRKAAESFDNLRKRTEDFQRAQGGLFGGSGWISFYREMATLRGYSRSEWQKAQAEWNDAMTGSYEDNQEYFEWLIANQEVISGKMYNEQKKAFADLINNLESYKDAIDEVGDVMSSVFGSLGDSIADSLINAFVETGDAATDLADNMQKTFSDLGLDIAKSLVSSFVISNILEKYKDTVESLFTYMSDSSADPNVIAAKFGELADNITQDADAAAQFTNALLGAMQANGIDFSDNGTRAMSNGIKSITEDTANLLASYINAIRADVSVTRTMVATILGLLPSAPTLSEYLAEIQANTYNTAVNTQFILERLDSTMAAYPNGGRAFNVNVS